jgi:hypothetical protein
MEKGNFTFDDFEFIEAKDLGSGYISRVKLARHRMTQRLYAVKIVD